MTQTQTYTKSDLTFNVFYNEDTTTKNFLQTLVLKNPWEWTMLRQVFEGKKKMQSSPLSTATSRLLSIAFLPPYFASR